MEKENEIKNTYRFFLKDNIRQMIDFSKTDQNRGIECPPIEKPYAADALKVELVKPGSWENINKPDLVSAIARRSSRRDYTKEPLTLEEVSFLLWAIQGVRGFPVSGHALRTVPSAGGRHALETYLAVLNVQNLEPGVYRYLPLSHQLLFEFHTDNLSAKIVRATLGQSFTGRSALTFIWTAIPYRMEWRYGLAAYKVIAIDAGHVCQNLYLAGEAIGAGTCAIAAYDQEAMDTLLHLDGEEEFTVYLAAVGKDAS